MPNPTDKSIEDILDEFSERGIHLCGADRGECWRNDEFPKYADQLKQLLIKERIKQVKHMVSYPKYKDGKLIQGYIDIDEYEIQEVLSHLQSQLGENDA